MKTNIPVLITSLTIGLTLVGARIARATEGDAKPVPANESSSKPLHTFSGTLRNVDVSSGALRVKSFLSSRVFEVGKSCNISLADKPEGTISDLVPGQKVEVSYQDYDGVRVATKVAQEDQTLTGAVLAVDPNDRTFRVKDGWFSKQFTAGPNCRLILRDDSVHTFKDLEIGERVSVKYVTPESGNVAQEIHERSLVYEGKVDALDARTDTIRAGDLLSEHTFRLGDNCQIVVNGKLGGELSDLRIGDHLNFHYEDVDGVFVANRIELETGNEEPKQAQLSSKESSSR
ncbi:hypothetical protein GC207_09520 [bacterium]|nr:hypothetical protein [bacterium]